MQNSEHFDRWADGYDQSVAQSDDEGTYPFAGYRALLHTLYRRICSAGGGRVLDLGFGTATLTAQLYRAGCTVYGQDFSPRMVALARAKMPRAHLYLGDLAQGLCPALLQQRYDAIVATYALHHLSDEAKVALLGRLQGLLAPGGCIYIGDVAFATRADLQQCRAAAGDEWDDTEFYFVYRELLPHFPTLQFTPISHCAGVLTLGQ